MLYRFPPRLYSHAPHYRPAYNKLKGLFFISGLLGLIGSMNSSSSVSWALVAGKLLPLTMAFNEPTMPGGWPAEAPIFATPAAKAVVDGIAISEVSGDSEYK